MLDAEFSCLRTGTAAGFANIVMHLKSSEIQVAVLRDVTPCSHNPEHLELNLHHSENPESSSNGLLRRLSDKQLKVHPTTS
jgi:hypothetical protein